ncbi:MlaD family protein [Aestuariibius sp. 2305UL40-4]|uniref:PqiB family protein n=1 Tax=Aestuariibius violaceus TaxID=3234132 RepID=UPI00345EC7E4
MTETPPEVEIEPVRQSLFQRVSLVWLIPLFAVVVALGLAYQNYAEQGPYIEVFFPEATGITAGETQLHYRDVTVGLVEDVGFSEDITRVRVGIRLDPEIAEFVDDDARFWIVTPEVSARGVTGLETVLSGVYIEALWDDEPEGLLTEFTGDARAPLVRPGSQGLRFRLSTTAGEGLPEGTPILYRGIEVGRIGTPVISDDGLTTIADAFIDAPHDRLVNTSTRFWDTSGFTFSLGPDGAEIDFQSIAALLGGGVSFDTVVSGGEPVEEGAVYRLYPDESTARSSVFADPDSDAQVQIMAIFDQNASGLTVGAPVQLSGINVGEVIGLTGIIDERSFGDLDVRLLATMALRPTRLGFDDTVDDEAVLALLEAQIAQGLRARLASASILTGGLKVEFVIRPDSPPAELDRAAIPFPLVPTVEAEIRDATATAEGVLQRINNLPVEEVLASAINLMDNASVLIASEEIRSIPVEVNELLRDTRALVGSEAVQGLPDQIGATAAAITEASEDLRRIIAQFEEQQGVERLLAAVDSAAATADAITARTEGIPDLIDAVADLAADIDSLDLAGLINRTNDVLTSANTLVSSEEVSAIPGNVNDILDQIETTLQELQTEELAGRLTAAINSAASAAEQADALIGEISESGTIDNTNQALQAATDAANAVTSATSGVPALIEEITALADTVEGLDFETLLAEATELVSTTETLLGNPETVELPANLNAALEEVDAILSGFREEQGVQTLIAAIESAGAAAQSVETSTEQLPVLVDNLTQLSERLRDLPLDQAIEEATAFLDSAADVLGTEDAVAMPGAINDVLGEIELVLQELRQGDVVANVNAAVASASSAARSIEAAADDLPALLRRLDVVLNQTGSTLAAYGDNSPANSELRAALRDIQQAADAVASLARAIERRPNSLLTGR